VETIRLPTENRQWVEDEIADTCDDDIQLKLRKTTITFRYAETLEIKRLRRFCS
jgi:hypothetical protein